MTRFRSVLVGLTVLLLAGCIIAPATSSSTPYDRPTGMGSYLNPNILVNPQPAMVQTSTNVSYAAPGSLGAADMTFNVWTPPLTSSPALRPVMIFFHGGRGETSAAHMSPAIRELYWRGFVIVSADYSESVATRTPPLPATTSITQGKRLVRLLKAIAALQGPSPQWNANRIYVSGISAGAHLAAMIGLTPGLFEPTDADVAGQNSTVAGVVGFQTPYDLTQMMTWANANVGNPAVSGEVGILEDGATTWFGCRLPARSTPANLPLCTAPAPAALIQQLSPKTYVAGSNPALPFYIVTGTKDFIVQSGPQGQAFSAALTARGATDVAGWTDIPGGTHSINTNIPSFVGSPPSSLDMLVMLMTVGCRPIEPVTGTVMQCLL